MSGCVVCDYKSVVCSYRVCSVTHRVDLESPAEPAHVQCLTVDWVRTLPEHTVVVHDKCTAVVLRHYLTETYSTL